VGPFFGAPNASPARIGLRYHSSAVVSDYALIWILGAHCERDSAARRELRVHDRFARRACFYEILQNAVRYRFVKCALVPIGSEIKLQGFAFDAEAVRHVIDIDSGKIGLARDWANRSEIVRFEMNSVIAARCRIRESLEARFRWRSGNFHFASSEQSQSGCAFCFCHGDIKVRPKASEVNRPCLLGMPADRAPRLDILLRALRRPRFRRQLVLRLAIRCSRRGTSGDLI
jgi:hypothetical protein